MVVQTMSRKLKKCRICRKRPIWQYRNSPGDVCKRCYHRHVWEGRASARKGGHSANETEDIDSLVEALSDAYGISRDDAFYLLFIQDE